MTRSRQAKAEDRTRSATKRAGKLQLRLDEFLPHRLSVLSNTVSRAIAGDYAERFGLSIPEWRVIAVLQYFPGASSGELTEKTGMDNVAISRAVNHLVRAGLITRRLCDADRRRTVLDLSEQGQAVYDEITPLALRYESLLLQELSVEERTRLDELLTKILRQAKQLGRGL
jgi:DNA-binding MarR family transcriptional regulator